MILQDLPSGQADRVVRVGLIPAEISEALKSILIDLEDATPAGFIS